MRDIIFRGRRLDTKEFTYGYLWAKNNCTVGRRILIMDSAGNKYEVDQKTIGQFTGRTDKNGKEAYGGDIVQHLYSGNVGVIKFGLYLDCDMINGGHVGFYVDWQKNRDILRKDLTFWLELTEIIGKVHEHKHLLDGGKEEK